ncbi:MAG: phage tail tube protein [Planctomycetota bacterium]
MPTTTYALGQDADLYLADAVFTAADAAAVGAANLNVMGNIRDCNMNLQTAESDVSSRDNNGWEATAATQKSGTVEFDAIWRKGDPRFTQVKDAWLTAGEIGAVCMVDGDKDTEGNQGLAGNFSVTNFSIDQQLREAVKVSVTLKPSSQTQWYTVPSS